MKRILSFLMLFVCFCTLSMAQAPKAGDIISGTVSDEIEPLMMVNVVEIDNNNRVVAHGTTDINGNFSFAIKSPKNRLRVSYIGCQTQFIPINKKHFKIVLASNTTIKTVDVVAKKKTQTSGLQIPVTEISVAQQTIDMKEFEGLALTSVDEALQGRISGLDIVANSGNLGSGTTMRLRGVSTINGNANPLIVVNGNVFQSAEIDANTNWNEYNEEKFAELLNVNPEDIESISVLKDAAATALWGSQGANGVIEIKTKRGQRGKTKVQYSYRLTGVWKGDGYKLLNGDDYTMYLKEAFFNPELKSTYGEKGNKDYIPEINYDPDFTEFRHFDDNTNWEDEISQFALQHQHFVSLMGGGEKANFRVSGGYDSQDNMIIKQHLDRFTTRVALDYFVSNRITVRTNFDLTYTKNKKNAHHNVLGLAYDKMPNVSVYEEDENGHDTDRFYTMNPYINYPVAAQATYLSDQYSKANPVAECYQAMNNQTTVNLTPEFILKYDVLGTEDNTTKLTYEGQVYFNIFSSKDEAFYPGSLVAGTWSSGEYNSSSTGSSKSNGLSTRHALTFVPHFNNPGHSLLMMARMQYNTGNSTSQSLGKKWLPSTGEEIVSPLGGGVITGFGSGASEWKSMYYLFQLHYAWKGKYIFDATVRRDGSTNFGPDKRWGNFPGISGRWNISDEKFMEKVKWVNMLSIRPGWGIVGNAPGGQNYYSYYNAGENYMGRSDMTTVIPTNIRLAALRWEEKETWNLGFDFGFFNNKISGDLSIYTGTTRDLLMPNRAIPSSSGYGSLAYQNVGSMRNNGWEFNLNGQEIIKKGKFSMDFNISFANNRNEILDMDPTVLASMNNEFNYSNGQYLTRVQLHNPLGSIYGFRYKGVYAYTDWSAEEDPGVSGPNAPVARDEDGNVIFSGYTWNEEKQQYEGYNPKQMYFDYDGKKYPFVGGDAIYEDVNHDGNINELDIVYLGSSLPKLTGGFGFKFHYGRWGLNLQFTYRYGSKAINNARMSIENMGTNNNQSRAVNWRWRNEGDSGENLLPRAATTQTNYNTYNYLGSDRFVENTSYLRFNYANLSYSFEPKQLKEWGMSTLSFYLTVNNIFCITKYSGIDPEIPQWGYSPASDGGRTPTRRSFTLGATIAF